MSPVNSFLTNVISSGLCWPAIYGYMLPSPPAGGAVGEQRQLRLYEEPLSQPQQEAQRRPSGAETEQEVTTSDKPMQLLHLEQSLTALWERVEAGGRREEQRHREVLQLYAELQEQQVEQIRTHLEQERQQREQVCPASSQTLFILMFLFFHDGSLRRWGEQLMLQQQEIICQQRGAA